MFARPRPGMRLAAHLTAGKRASFLPPAPAPWACVVSKRRRLRRLVRWGLVDGLEQGVEPVLAIQEFVERQQIVHGQLWTIAKFR